MKISVIDLKQKLRHRIGVAGVALAAATAMAVVGAPTAGAASWVGSGGTGYLGVDNGWACQNHADACYGVLAIWDVELSITGISVFYQNMTCVGPTFRQVDSGYIYPSPRDWGKKWITPVSIEDYIDNPCYNMAN